MSARAIGALVLLGLVVLAPAAARAQAGGEDDGPRSGLRWRNRPSIQIGEHVRLDLRLKLQFDVRRFDPEIGEDEDDFRVRRGGINGEIGDHVEFQIERDLNSDGRWRDVYANWRTFRQFQVAAGRFKVPFGREELVSISDVDFAFRSLVSTTIPPARDRGVMAHGRFLQRGITYEVGVYDDDGDNGRLQEPQFAVSGNIEDIGPSIAGRVTATPLRRLGDALETFRVGLAYGAADIPEGLNSLRGETVYGTTDFFPPVYVSGRRTRLGTELFYTPGPFGFAAEWMQAREQRLGQGLGDVDLSDFITTGWYASATWLVTGEDKEDFDSPRRPLFGGGAGAIEVGARIEELRFESEDKTGTAFRNPRAEHILPNADRVLTVGVNWWPSRWTRLTVNGIHEEFEDARRTPEIGTTAFWSGVLRLQLAF
jgi:phosphate-selective porin OprO/OprP